MEEPDQAAVEAFIAAELPNLPATDRERMAGLLLSRTSGQLDVIRAMLGDKPAQKATGGKPPKSDDVEKLIRAITQAISPLFDGKKGDTVYRGMLGATMAVILTCAKDDPETEVALLMDAAESLATLATLRTVAVSKVRSAT